MASPPGGPLDLLLSLGHDLFVIRDLPTLLDSALQRLMAYTSHDSGSIMLCDRDRSSLEVRASLGVDAVPVGTQVPNLQRSVAGQVLASERPLLLQGRGEAICLDWRDYSAGIMSVVCLPLLLAGQPPVGVVALKTTAVVRALDDGDVKTLQLLASQLAVVIENARLHAECERLIADLAVREIMLMVHENLDYLVEELKSGAAGYDLKDATRRELISAIRQMMRGEPCMTPELMAQALRRLATRPETPPRHQVEHLTPRETEVLRLLIQGQTNRQIAAQLGISPGTVKVHVERIIAKLGVVDRTQAAVRAIELHLV